MIFLKVHVVGGYSKVHDQNTEMSKMLGNTELKPDIPQGISCSSLEIHYRYMFPFYPLLCYS